MSKEGQYPTTRDIFLLLGVGALIVGSIIAPGLGMAAGSIIRAKRRYEFEQGQKEWRKFNLRLLRRNLKRLQEQKMVEIREENGQEIIKLTQQGRTKYLKFKLGEISEKSKSWSGKWYLVIYDIGRLKKAQQESFRRVLKQMRFLPLQESVYLIPYKCQSEVEYLREYFNLSEEVMLLEVNKLENERYYKDYFGIT